MISFPNSKINIGLFVTSKRGDGYHNLESVFYPVPCVDALEFVVADSIRFSSTGLTIPGDADSNLVVKAYQILKSDFQQIDNLHIHLHKMIPMGAGVGGGSADGAFMLTMLNTYFELNLDKKTLQEYAGRLGSDCPFFIENKPAFVSGRGEELCIVDLNLSGWWLVLVFPQIHVSTKIAFSRIVPRVADFDLRNLGALPVEDWKYQVVNQFENSVFEEFPKIKEIKQALYNEGAIYASMSGSGSAVYGLFKHQPDEKKFKLNAETRIYEL